MSPLAQQIMRVGQMRSEDPAHVLAPAKALLVRSDHSLHVVGFFSPRGRLELQCRVTLERPHNLWGLSFFFRHLDSQVRAVRLQS